MMQHRQQAQPTAGARPGASRYDDNLTAERPTFVTHLECSGTGERPVLSQAVTQAFRRNSAGGMVTSRRRFTTSGSISTIARSGVG